MDLLSPWRSVHQVASAVAVPVRVWALGGLFGLALAGCSAMPDALNPVEWVSSADSYLSGEDEAADPELAARAEQEQAEPVPGADEPFPSLGAVPGQAPKVTAYDERQQIAQGLVADRAAARYVDNPAAEAVMREPALAWREPTAPAVERAPEPEIAAGAPAPAVTVTEAAPMPAPTPMAAAEPEPETLPEPMPVPAAGPVASAPMPMPATAVETEAMPWLEAAPVPMAASAPRRETMAPPAPVATATPALEAPASVRVAAAAPVLASAAAPASRPLPVEASGPAMGSVHAGVIYFAYGSTSLSAADTQVLGQIADLYRSRGGRVRVVGHSSGRVDGTDEVKAKLANFAVAFDRARMVAEELARQGVPADQIFPSSMSSDAPAYSETTKLGEAANRRADIYIDF
ncbi:MAG TPA: OmpA family protein [Alphaproteobacteria bacterium]